MTVGEIFADSCLGLSGSKRQRRLTQGLFDEGGTANILDREGVPSVMAPLPLMDIPIGNSRLAVEGMEGRASQRCLEMGVDVVDQPDQASRGRWRRRRRFRFGPAARAAAGDTAQSNTFSIVFI